MVTATYGSFRQQIPDTSFAITATTGTAANIERNFYLQFRNRAGVNLLSNKTTITSTGVQVTINAGAILDHEEVFWIVVSAETTGNEQDAGILAQIQARDPDQITRRSLPITLDLTTDEHFVTNRQVATEADLPTTGILPGAIAKIASVDLYFRYDPELTVDTENRAFSYGAYLTYELQTANLELRKWVKYNGTFNIYLADTFAGIGSDRAVFTVENALKTPPKIGQADGTPLRYWLNNGFANDGGSITVSGRFTFDIGLNGGEDFETVFADRIRYTLGGYINKNTDTLDVAIATVNTPLLWNPVDQLVELPAPLNRNHAAVYDVNFVFDNDDLNGVIPAQYTSSTLDFVEVLSIQGKPNELGRLVGDLALSDRNKALVVPGLTRLSGLISIGAGYLPDLTEPQEITDLTPDTADQQIVISGALNGFTSVKQSGTPLESSEVLRAVVSTELGISKLVAAAQITLAGQAIAITVTHPVNASGLGIIRADYPDTLIAGNEQGSFTPINAFVFFDIDGTIYQSQVQNVTPTQTQPFTFTDTGSLTAIASLPTQPDPEFSLFEPVSLAAASSGGGSITGNVTVYIGYSYETPNIIATKISHDSPPAITTANYTIGEILNFKAELDAHTGDLNNPHQVTPAQINAATTAQLATTNNNVTTNTDAIALNTASRNNQGTAATQDVGTTTNNVVQLQNIGGSPGLPAVDGSLLTGVSGQLSVEFVSGTFAATVSATSPVNYLIDTSTAVSTVNLPASPPDKGIVAFSDRNKTFGTNIATLTPDVAHTINGDPSFSLNFDNEAVTLVFDAANNNYVVLDGIQNTSTGSGDMTKAQYDTNDSGVVDESEAITGTPGNSKFYGTDAAGTKGFFDYLVGAAVKATLESLTDPNKLSGSAIANARNISAAPTDDYCLTYDLATDALVYRPRIQLAGAGVILQPITQSLFEAPDGTLITAYTPDVGTATPENVKILTTAAVASNTIQTERGSIAVTNTGYVQDLGVSNTVYRTDWVFTTGDNLAILCRYDSDGNMVIIDLSGTAIAVKSIVNDVITTIETTPFTFTTGNTYKIDVQIVGVQYKVLIDDVVAIAEALNNEFLTATKFGIGRLN